SQTSKGGDGAWPERGKDVVSDPVALVAPVLIARVVYERPPLMHAQLAHHMTAERKEGAPDVLVEPAHSRDPGDTRPAGPPPQDRLGLVVGGVAGGDPGGIEVGGQFAQGSPPGPPGRVLQPPPPFDLDGQAS